MNLKNRPYMGQPMDMSEPFYTLGNTHYNAVALEDFNGENLSGLIKTQKCARKTRMSFNTFNAPFETSTAWTFPAAYSEEPAFPFKLSLIDAHTLRLRVDFSTLSQAAPYAGFTDASSLMLTDTIENLMQDANAKITENANGLTIKTTFGRFEIQKDPFTLRFYDAQDTLLTKMLTQADSMCLQNCNPLPFSCVTDSEDMRRYSAVSLQAFAGEAIYGCGESFSKLDKTGQKFHLWTHDPHGVETNGMYKPIPFYMSSRGYGVFMHTSAPITVDFAGTYHEAHTLYAGEDKLDLFFFIGSPKDILSAYTRLTGRPQVPPLWSFGLWMGRITYRSEEEMREVAKNLRVHEIPCDVLHLDTGWFEDNWRCDYQFSKARFEDPRVMMADLKKLGYHVSLWQLPYFTPQNPLTPEIIANGMAIHTMEGGLPTEDAVLDFSNPHTVAWYQQKLTALFEQGVSAIKADFGESAPFNGVYASGQSGRLEHNLYPLRYNKIVAEATKAATGESIIWARSAWAGSQRYPLHWGGDAENTNVGMLSSLRGGLSLGMSGFPYWSHDLGGFVRPSPEELYGRWCFMGVFTSHLRAHGNPPKEPWAYSETFLNLFRKQMAFRYSLMPYIIAQATACAAQGVPMLRPMHFDYPKDVLCRTLEDQYMFGDELLIAPFFEDEQTEREVYLPQGVWRNLFTGETYTGGMHRIADGGLRGVALVRGGAVIPMMEPALTTAELDWQHVRFHHFAADNTLPHGLAPDGKEVDAAFLEANKKRVVME